MIQGQLGSLTSSTPSGPSWESKMVPRELDRMEEGRKPEELQPMYMEGRSVQAGGFGNFWSQHRWLLLAGALLLLGLLFLFGPSLGAARDKGASGRSPDNLPPEASGAPMLTADGVGPCCNLGAY